MDETLDIKSCPIEFPNLLWRKDLRDSNGSHVKQTKRSDASDFFLKLLFRVLGAATT